MLMLQAFPRADGLCQPLGIGLNARARVSLLPRVCYHHAGPPPPPPPRGGLTLVMSGDHNPKNDSHDLLALVAQSIRNQPVGGSTFAQKHAPIILGFFLLLSSTLSSLFLAVILRNGILNVGKGTRTRVWLGGKLQDKPVVEVRFPQLPFVVIPFSVATCAWLVIHPRGVISCPNWAGR